MMSERKEIADLEDGYIKSLILKDRFFRTTGLESIHITQKMIEAKRESLKAKRLLRKHNKFVLNLHI